jgi:hypothetical protein
VTYGSPIFKGVAESISDMFNQTMTLRIPTTAGSNPRRGNNADSFVEVALFVPKHCARYLRSLEVSFFMVRVGVVGVGSFGEKRAAAATAVSKEKLIGVADVSPKRARDVVQKLGAPAFAVEVFGLH